MHSAPDQGPLSWFPSAAMDLAGFCYTDYTTEHSDLCVHLVDLAFLAPFWNLNWQFESRSLRKEAQAISKDVINVPNNKAVALKKWYLSNRLIFSCCEIWMCFFLLTTHASTVPTPPFLLNQNIHRGTPDVNATAHEDATTFAYPITSQMSLHGDQNVSVREMSPCPSPVRRI